MCGIDVHIDPNIGKRLNALGNTLTSLTGEEDVDDIADLNSVNMADLSDEDEADTLSPTIHMVSSSVNFWSLILKPELIRNEPFCITIELVVNAHCNLKFYFVTQICEVLG